jgi:hypothetical protein
MLPDKGIYSVAVLKSIEQRRQTFGLIVQREHHLVHQGEGTLARLSQHTSLSNPVLKKRELHRFRPISPEVVNNRIGVCLGSNKMRIHASSFGRAVKARICEKRPKIKTCTSKSMHSEGSSETHTSEIFQDCRSRREETSRIPQHAMLSTEQRRPWQ